MMDETEKLRKDDGLESGMHSQSLIVYLQHKTLLVVDVFFRQVDSWKVRFCSRIQRYFHDLRRTWKTKVNAIIRFLKVVFIEETVQFQISFFILEKWWKICRNVVEVLKKTLVADICQISRHTYKLLTKFALRKLPNFSQKLSNFKYDSNNEMRQQKIKITKIYGLMCVKIL